MSPPSDNVDDNRKKIGRLLYQLNELDDTVSKLTAIIVEMRRKLREVTIQVVKFKERDEQ